jgi:hypothetical protein
MLFLWIFGWDQIKSVQNQEKYKIQSIKIKVTPQHAQVYHNKD